jgi:putative redox protein
MSLVEQKQEWVTGEDQPRAVLVEGSAKDFAQAIAVGRHRFVSDEPVAAGGTDTGPDPYALLLAALGSCTSMTVALYARRKQWRLDKVRVRLWHSKTHADDCAECEKQGAMLDRIDREIELEGTLDEQQRARLLDIANKCPVHRTLTSEIRIQTRLVGPGKSG